VYNDATKQDIIVKRVREIAEIVASFYGFTVADLIGRSRKGPLAKARHVAMYICRVTTDHTLEDIGFWFGGRDHSTIGRAVSVLLSDAGIYIDLQAEIDEIMTLLAESRMETGDGSRHVYAPREIYICVNPVHNV